MKRLLSCFTAGVAICVLSVSCKKDISENGSAKAALPADALSANKAKVTLTVTVQPGQSIQAAVDAASPGTVIKIKAGIYKEAVLVDKKDITLQGEGENSVTIQNPGAANNGITVKDNGDGFVMENITVKNFVRNGVLMARVDNFRLSHITADHCGEYGIYPVHCTNGIIEHCTAFGHNDSGLYIGQSSQIQMNHNEAYENVIGIEIENCTDVTADKNHAYNNAGGMLVVLLPGLPVKNTTGTILTKNQVQDNNHENLANPDAGFEKAVPQGSGILLVGAKNSLLSDNHVTGNNFVGIATVSTTILGAILGTPPEAFGDIDPIASGNKITGNHVTGNGSAPPPLLPLPGGDLLWDGNGTGNCWSNNKFATATPSSLPSCN